MRSNSMQGEKHDQAKIQGALLLDFSRALQAVAELGTHGTEKYSRSGWLSVQDGITRYSDAMLRHLLLENQEAIDPESGLPHAYAVAWNALARLELILREEEYAEDQQATQSLIEEISCSWEYERLQEEQDERSELVGRRAGKIQTFI